VPFSFVLGFRPHWRRSVDVRNLLSNISHPGLANGLFQLTDGRLSIPREDIYSVEMCPSIRSAGISNQEMSPSFIRHAFPQPIHCVFSWDRNMLDYQNTSTVVACNCLNLNREGLILIRPTKGNVQSIENLMRLSRVFVIKQFGVHPTLARHAMSAMPKRSNGNKNKMNDKIRTAMQERQSKTPGPCASSRRNIQVILPLHLRPNSES
jgi:hypothetical protein